MNLTKAIAGCKQNYRVCQEWLYKTYAPRMLSLCRRFTTNDDDLITYLNDGFMKVFKSLDKLDDEEKFEPWFKRILYNTIYDHIRKNKKHQLLIELDQQDKESAADGLNNLFEQDIISMLDQIPATSAEVFVLYAVHGYSHKEIGSLKGISEGTSKWHYSEARKRLKNLIEEQKRRLHVIRR